MRLSADSGVFTFHDDFPDVESVLAAMQSNGLLITNVEVRRRLERIIDAFQYMHDVVEWHRDSAYQVARKGCEVGRNSLGAMLRDETLPDADVLEEYHDAIVKAERAFEEAEREHIASLETELSSNNGTEGIDL